MVPITALYCNMCVVRWPLDPGGGRLLLVLWTWVGGSVGRPGVIGASCDVSIRVYPAAGART